MITKAKKLLITTAKHEIFIMRLGAVEAVLGFCERCDAEVEMLTLDSAVRVSGINGHRIVQQLASGQIHSIETVNGHLLLCRESVIGILIDKTQPGASPECSSS